MGPRSLPVAVLAGAAIAAVAGSAAGQVVRDGTLGPGAHVRPSGPSYVITEQMGARPGNGPNLFHSFGTFSLGDTPAGRESAHFQAGAGVDNIFARVTGGQESSIGGRLGADANLFLMNPAGIVFGRNASLDVNGSFHATTADAIQLSDGERFRADPAHHEVLSVAAPRAFGFLGAARGSIAVNAESLETPAGQSLSLVAEGLVLADTSLRAPGGHIHLASVTGRGDLPLVSAPPDLTTSGLIGGDVQVSYSSIDVNDYVGDGAGGVTIEGGRLVVDATEIQADSGDGESGSGVSLRATERLVLANESLVSSDAWGSADSGPILLGAPELRVLGCSCAGARSLGGGRAGSVALVGDVVVVDEAGVGTRAEEGDGDAGGIHVSAGTLRLVNGGFIASETLTPGTAGDVTIRVRDELVLDAGSFLGSEAVSSSGEGLCAEALSGPEPTGDAGRVDVEAGRLAVLNEASISSETKSAGRAGDIRIRVRGEVFLDGEGNISSEAASGTGDAGSIVVEAGSLDALNESGISSETLTDGAGGSIKIGVQDHLIVEHTGYISSETRAGDGDAGSIVIDAGRIEVLSDGGITSATFAEGAAGAITIRATGLLVIDGGFVRSISDAGTGDAGSVRVESKRLAILNGGRINSETTGSGHGGDVILRVESLEMANGAFISTESEGSGRAGRIEINVTDTVELADSMITTEALNSFGGSISINGDSILKTSDGRLVGIKRSDQTPGVLVDLLNSSITASVGAGEGDGGNIFIDPVFLVLQNSPITATAKAGNGGNILIRADFVFADRPLEELLNASSEKGVSGTVLLSAAEANIVSSVTALPARFLDATALLRQRCAQRGGKGTGSFVVAGTSGIAPSPDAPLAARGGETQPASVGQVQPAGLVITQDGDGHSVGLVVTCESEFGSS